jgi:membrane protein implicated in regulation of membrane protease activity
MGGLFELYGTHGFWIWAGIAAALLAAEVATGSGWLLWPAACAAIVSVLMLFLDLPAPVTILIFAALTIVSTLVSRRMMAQRTLPEGGDINDPISRLVGHQGRAVTTFDDGEGRVFVDGKEWPAQLDQGEALAEGDAVRVTGVSGALLTVRPAR